MSAESSPPSRLYEQIYALVRLIPYGKVATYGQIAALMGRYGLARQVGYALYRVAPDSDVPWHRVINAQGKISRSPERFGNDDLQEQLLKQEGIVFDPQGAIDLKRYLWQPQVDPSTFTQLEPEA